MPSWARLIIKSVLFSSFHFILSWMFHVLIFIAFWPHVIHHFYLSNNNYQHQYSFYFVRLLMYTSILVYCLSSLLLAASAASFGFNPFFISHSSGIPSLSASAGAGNDCKEGHAFTVIS